MRCQVCNAILYDSRAALDGHNRAKHPNLPLPQFDDEAKRKAEARTVADEYLAVRWNKVQDQRHRRSGPFAKGPRGYKHPKTDWRTSMEGNRSTDFDTKIFDIEGRSDEEKAETEAIASKMGRFMSESLDKIMRDTEASLALVLIVTKHGLGCEAGVNKEVFSSPVSILLANTVAQALSETFANHASEMLAPIMDIIAPESRPEE